MKIAYIGTPELSAGLLKKIIENKDTLELDIVTVITQPDQPVGRKQVLTASPVKELARQNNLPISHNLSVLADQTIDLALLFAFGRIISQEMLDLPTHGFWNIHPSLLPAYRGATPTVFPILMGDAQSGITLMQMDADLDHGPIIDQSPFVIQKTSIREELEKEIINISFQMVAKNIKQLNDTGSVAVVQQNHSLATYTRPLTKQDGYLKTDILLKAIKGEEISSEQLPDIIVEYYKTNNLDLSSKTYNAADVVWNMHRALHGWPGIWTFLDINSSQKRFKILDALYSEKMFLPKIVQLDGKNPVSFETFLRAYPIL